jgi:hypothetical protein
MGLLLWFAADVFAARDAGEAALWPDERSVTVWTGKHWFTATVMRVAFGRWGIAICREVVPRRAEPLELVTRVRSEREAHRVAYELAAEALDERGAETVAIEARIPRPSRLSARPIRAPSGSNGAINEDKGRTYHVDCERDANSAG